MKGNSKIRIKNQLVKVLLVLMSLFSSTSAMANRIISTKEKGVVVVTQSNNKHRVCYYNDKAYSIGAVIEVSGVVIKCTAENDFETNSALAWIEVIKKTK
jgi:hypothetical protein